MLRSSGQRRLQRWGTSLLMLAVSLPVWFCTGCDGRDPSRASDRQPDPSSLDTPLTVARALCAWHREGRYRLLARYVLPEQRVLLVDTLMAYDRLLSANQRAKRRILATHNEWVAGEFDLAGLANRMGLFSRDVDFHGERIDGDRAVVSAQVAGRVPLQEYRFVRRQGRWVYAPEAPIPSLPELIRDLAAGVEQFEFQLGRGELSVEQIRSEFRHRVHRRMRAIRSALPVSQPSAGSAARP